jgi:hypothetical protein
MRADAGRSAARPISQGVKPQKIFFDLREAANAVRDAGFTPFGWKRRSAEIDTRGSMCLAADITKSLLPRHSSIAAGALRCCKSRAAGPTLVSKCLLTISAAQASSLILGPASIIFKEAAPKLRIAS